MSHRKVEFVADGADFRAVFAGNPLPMWVYDLETLEFLEVNDAAVAWYGYSRKEFLRMRLSDIGPPEEAPRFYPEVERSRTGLQFSGGWRQRRKDGRLIDASLILHTIEFGGRPAILAVSQNAADRPRADGDRQELEARYRQLFDNTNDLVYTIDPTGRFTSVNQAALTATGYTLEEALSVNVTAVVAPEYLDLVRTMMARKLDGTEDTNRYDIEIVTKDGRRIPVELSTRVILAEGRAVGIQGIARNVADRKHAEEKLRLVYETQAQRVAELEALYNLSGLLRAAQRVEDMYPLLTGYTKDLLRADVASLAVWEPKRKVLTCADSTGGAGEMPGTVLSLHGSLPGWVVRTGVMYLADDFPREPVPTDMDVSPYRTSGPVVIMPVRSEQEVTGTLSVTRARGSGRPPFAAAELRLLKGIAEMAGTAVRRAQLYHDLHQTHVQTVLALAHAIESRDFYTANHGARLVALSEAVARKLGCREEEIEDIRWGARLHDIGKIGVPDSVLGKPQGLTEPEWTLMRRHPEIGADIIGSVDRMRGVAKIVRHHQEKWDGTGYPDGLRGAEIPLGARILAVVDAYGAMTDARPYQPARAPEEAIAEIRRCAGTQFDPRVVEVFCAAAQAPDGAP